MNDLMKCLYDFAMERRMGDLKDDEEYQECVLSVKMQTERMKECLNQEQQKELRWLIDMLGFQNSIVNEHVFCAALGLSGELNALVRA